MTILQRSSVAITGGRVVPVEGEVIDGGTVLVRDGVIAALGRDITIPEGVAVHDASGKWVLPGFVESHAHLGVHEEGEGWEGRDVNETTSPNGAALRAIDGIDIDEEGFRDALIGGVTSAVIKPGSANPIGGQTVAIKTWGGRTVDEQVLEESVSVKSALGENPKRVYSEKQQEPATRLGVAKVIREAFVQAQDYVARREHAESEGKPFDRDLGLETLARVLAGELVWDQHTHRHDDIATAMRLAAEFGYRLIVNHGTDGARISDVLAEHDVPVIFGPMFTSRTKVEVRTRDIAHLARLAEAGVQVAITTDHPVVPIDFLVYQAALAVKEGLDPDVALQAMTINPARILGLDKRVGSLAQGKDGDVVVWSGDPLDVYSRAEEVFISGQHLYSRAAGGVREREQRFTTAT